jgi:hypothetical protein
MGVVQSLENNLESLRMEMALSSQQYESTIMSMQERLERESKLHAADVSKLVGEMETERERVNGLLVRKHNHCI